MKFDLEIRKWFLKYKTDKGIRPWSIFFRVMGVLVLLGLVGYLIYQIIDVWGQIKDYPWQIKPIYLIFGFLLYTATLSLNVFAWSRIMGCIAGKVSYWVHFRFYVLTILANRLPTPLPYAGARAAIYSTIGIDQSLTLGAFAFEGSVTILSGMLIGILLLPFSRAGMVLDNTGWGLVVLIPLIAVVFWPGKLIKIINSANRRLKRTEISVEVSSIDTLLWVLISMIMWICAGTANLVVMGSIYPVDIYLLPTYIGIIALTGVIGWISQLLFFLPTMAVRQVAAVYLLSPFFPWPVALAASVLSRLVGLVHELLWATSVAMIQSFKLSKKDKKND